MRDIINPTPIVAQAEAGAAINFNKAVEELQHLGRNNWRVGELADRVKPVYGEETMARLAEEGGIEFKTLHQCRTVHRAWPFAERSESLPWAVHAVFASQDDRFTLIKRRKWTVKAAREEVQRRNEAAREAAEAAREAAEAATRKTYTVRRTGAANTSGGTKHLRIRYPRGKAKPAKATRMVMVTHSSGDGDGEAEAFEPARFADDLSRQVREAIAARVPAEQRGLFAAIIAALEAEAKRIAGEAGAGGGS